MSPLDKETIQKRLLKLRQIISSLHLYAQETQKNFITDSMLSDASMYQLTIGIEIVIDIGNHILSESFQKSAEDYTAVLQLLGEVGIAPKKMIEANKNMAGFRNILVHDYIEVDIKKVYKYLQKAPDVFQQFADCYIKFLDKH